MLRKQASGSSVTERPSAIPRSTRSLQPVEELVIVEETADYAISTWRFVMFLAWRANVTVAGINRSRELMEPWASRWPQGIVLTVLAPSRIAPGPPPSEEVRAAMTNASREAPACLKGIAFVSGKAGFVGSIIRSIVAARRLIARHSVRFQIFESPAEAAPWVVRAVGMPELGNEFVAAAEKARV